MAEQHVTSSSSFLLRAQDISSTNPDHQYICGWKKVIRCVHGRNKGLLGPSRTGRSLSELNATKYSTGLGHCTPLSWLMDSHTSSLGTTITWHLRKLLENSQHLSDSQFYSKRTNGRQSLKLPQHKNGTHLKSSSPGLQAEPPRARCVFHPSQGPQTSFRRRQMQSAALAMADMTCPASRPRFLVCNPIPTATLTSLK